MSRKTRGLESDCFLELLPRIFIAGAFEVCQPEPMQDLRISRPVLRRSLTETLSIRNSSRLQISEEEWPLDLQLIGRVRVRLFKRLNGSCKVAMFLCSQSASQGSVRAGAERLGPHMRGNQQREQNEN